MAPHPQNLEMMWTLVQCWEADHKEWQETGKASDGTVFPPKWPLTYVETAGFIRYLKENQKLPEPTIAANV